MDPFEKYRVRPTGVSSPPAGDPFAKYRVSAPQGFGSMAPPMSRIPQPGETPEDPIQEQHEKISPGYRASLMAAAPETAYRNLVKVFGDGNVSHHGGHDFSVRETNGKWKKLDPSKLEWADVTDLWGDVLNLIGMGVGAAVGGAAAVPTTGPASPLTMFLTASAGSGAGSAAAESVKQFIVKSLGLDPTWEEASGKVMEEGIIGTAAEMGGQIISKSLPYIAKGLKAPMETSGRIGEKVRNALIKDGVEQTDEGAKILEKLVADIDKGPGIRIPEPPGDPLKPRIKTGGPATPSRASMSASDEIPPSARAYSGDPREAALNFENKEFERLGDWRQAQRKAASIWNSKVGKDKVNWPPERRGEVFDLLEKTIAKKYDEGHARIKAFARGAYKTSARGPIRQAAAGMERGIPEEAVGAGAKAGKTAAKVGGEFTETQEKTLMDAVRAGGFDKPAAGGVAGAAKTYGPRWALLGASPFVLSHVTGIPYGAMASTIGGMAGAWFLGTIIQKGPRWLEKLLPKAPVVAKDGIRKALATYRSQGFGKYRLMLAQLLKNPDFRAFVENAALSEEMGVSGGPGRFPPLPRPNRG